MGLFRTGSIEKSKTSKLSLKKGMRLDLVLKKVRHFGRVLKQIYLVNSSDQTRL